MKRIAGILLVLLMAGISLPTAAEESAVPSAEGAVAADTVTAEALAVDTTHRYEGMEQTYAEGYIPTVTEAGVHLLLPLTAVHPIVDSTITVRADLGNPDKCPFVWKNYDRPFHLEICTDSEGEAQLIFLVAFDLELTEDHEPGRYPVTLTASGTVLEGQRPFMQSFTVFVTLSAPDPEPTTVPEEPEPTAPEIPADGGGGVDTGGSPSGGSSGEGKPPSAPRLLLTAYTIMPSPVLEGQNLTFSGTLKNMSRKQTLTNVLVTVQPEGTALVSAGAPLSFWFDKIAPEGAVSFDAQLQALSAGDASPQKIGVRAVYEGKDAKEYESSDTVTIAISQPMRLEWDEPEIPASLHAGDTMAVSIQVMNLGRATIYNLRAQIEAPGLTPQNSLFLGNADSGTAKKGDLYAFVGTLESEEGQVEDRYGRTAGTITLTGENQDGESVMLTEEFETMIEPPVIHADPEPEEPEEDTSFQWILIAVIVGAATAVVAAILLRRSKERTRD